MRPDAVEMGSAHSLHDHHDTPLPTPPEEKKAVTVKRLSYVLGFLYSLFLIITAVTILVATALVDDPWTVKITIYVTVSGLVILCTLIVDVKLFTRRIRKQIDAIRKKENTQELDYQEQFNEPVQENGKHSTNDEEPKVGFIQHTEDGRNSTEEPETCTGFIPHTQELEHIEHKYCFAQGRHAGSVYLKFGAAAFALGHFVHTLLLVVMVHWSFAVNKGKCINFMEYIAGLLQCLFCFVQLFFVFNYSNLIIIKRANLWRFALLHVMSGNICLWVAAVTTETKIAYRAYESQHTEVNITNEYSTNTSVPPATSHFKWDASCRPTAVVARIFDEYSAYLYPFTVEFNILVVGIFFMVWSNIGKCRHSSEEVQHFHQSLYAHDHTGDINSPHALEIHISCRSALCGLFSSLFVIVLLIVAVILGFVLGNISNENTQYIGLMFADSVKLAFHLAMLVASAVAFYKTQSLDINKHPIPWLDDVLLYISVPAFFLETILTVIPTIATLRMIQFLDTIIMSLQMTIQIAFIIDGLRRCSNSRKLRRTKPGRDLILFLLVTNVSMWVMYTFSYHSPDSKDVRYEYYGKKMWLAIGHICLPIIMFFRFHSSVCIADIWVHAYAPGIENH